MNKVIYSPHPFMLVRSSCSCLLLLLLFIVGIVDTVHGFQVTRPFELLSLSSSSLANVENHHHNNKIIRQRRKQTNINNILRTTRKQSLSSSSLFMIKNINNNIKNNKQITKIIIDKMKTTIITITSVVITYIKHFISLLRKLSIIICHELSTLNKKQQLLFISIFIFGIFIGKIKPFWKQYTNVLDIPLHYFVNSNSSNNSNSNNNNTPILKGRAISISDGDTIRFLHTPTIWSKRTLLKGQKVSQYGLPIRLCTIDAPETSKFGKPGQPYGIEAKEFLTNLLQYQTVYIRLLTKDQYGRAVAEVYIKKHSKFIVAASKILCNVLFCWFLIPYKFIFNNTNTNTNKNNIYMDEIMLENGFAEVYLGSGAVYGPLGKDIYLDLQEKAKKKKVGIWSQNNRESASDYKKRTK